MACTIGFDFGSLSARGVLMNADSGAVLCSAVFDYPHGIMTRRLPDGTPLPTDWALQDPEDYRLALREVTHALLARSGIDPSEVIGLGLDTTACTLLPTTEEGIPLCRPEGHGNDPHAWVKLWKHHAAQPYVPAIEAAAEQTDWYAQFGSAISGEHYLPKVTQLAAEAPHLYREAARIIQMGDWLVWRLTGQETRGYCCAAFKTFYRKDRGDVSREFLSSVHPLLSDLNQKQPAPVLHDGCRAGVLTEEAAQWLGLRPGTAVAAAGVDAHVTVYGCHIHQPGRLLLIVGTSTCAILNSETYREIPGLNGVVPEGILPGLNAYEGGQACVGDLFAWFTDHCVPAHYERQAESEGKSLHALLTEKAAALAPGESGLVALDWWNGARSLPMDFDLSGMILGLTLNTRPEEIYRALIEATAFGARRIIDAMEESGIRIDALILAGGIPKKNPLLAEIYADVCGREVYVTEQEHTGALGSAVLGAAAALHGGEGFRHLPELLRRYEADAHRVYRPDRARAAVYQRLYAVYRGLYDSFRRDSAMMKELKSLRLSAREKSAEPH